MNNNFKKEEILNFAMMGINSEIEKHQAKIDKARKYLNNRALDTKDKCPCSNDQLEMIITNHSIAINDLIEYRMNLEWSIEIDDLNLV